MLVKGQRATFREVLHKNAHTQHLKGAIWFHVSSVGEFEQARTYMRQALSLDRTGSAELPLHYGDILFALGERFMAETYWRKALELGADAKRIEQRITIPKDTPTGTRIEDIIKE